MRPTFEMQPCRVLIVDDQRDVRRMLRAALETLDAGMSITDVPSGEEAILVIARQPVELLISDVRLPGISGLELIERTRVRNPELHLILITGMTDDATRQQLDHAMADAYFFKPLKIGDLLDTVQDLLGIRGNRPAVEEAPRAEEQPAGSGARDVVESAGETSFLEAHNAQTAATAPEIEPPAAEGFVPAETGPQRILNELRARLDATLAALVNSRGETLELSGEIAAEIDEWVAVLRLTSGLAESSGEPARTLIFAPGARVDFWVTPIVPGTVLVVGASHPAWHDLPFGELAVILSRAAQELLSALDAGAPISADAAEPPPADDVLQSLDELFANLPAQTLKSIDIDAFWDMAAEGHSVPGEREGGMTYDEARRLGLAPDED